MAREAVIALKVQTIEGGKTVQPGEEIPPKIAATIGPQWFDSGFVKRVVVKDEPKPRPRRKPSA